MLIRLTTDRVGYGLLQRAGDEIELPEKEALALIRAGSAEAVEPEAAAVVPHSETATTHRARPRRRQ